MRIHKLWTILSIGLVCSCASGHRIASLANESEGDNASVLSPSAVLALPDDAIGTEILVEGVLRFGPEYAGIWDSRADIEQGNFRSSCVTIWDRDGRIPAFRTAKARVRGTVLDARKSRIIVLGSCGNNRMILVSEFSEST
jgi:hypothetical protein